MSHAEQLNKKIAADAPACKRSCSRSAPVSSSASIFCRWCLTAILRCERRAGKIGVSYRQAKRLKQAFVRNGARGVLHGNIGRRSHRALSDHVRTRILHLARTRYAALNDTQLTLRLQAEHGISLSRETIRRILRAEGIKRTRPEGQAAATRGQPAMPVKA